ncbi:hypothetical protein ABIB40_003841 [Pedobacter sp. UYP30]|uniref:hypothetical protein n=1 Tax=Pedobacter sp. UYP30 TaxID=1756400 RepID=UPI0033983F14
MDTDDLSKEAYNGILTEAGKFNRDLTLQFGLLASNCENDDDYLNQTEALITEWLNVEDFEDIIDDIFFGEEVNLKLFRNVLKKILGNISKIRKTAMDKRTFEDW